VGPQTVAGRRFDAAVVELFGDAQRGDSYTRIDGALVVDRLSGVLLRLDLSTAQPASRCRGGSFASTQRPERTRAGLYPQRTAVLRGRRTMRPSQPPLKE
jgi:hypothetical protein